MKIAKKIKLARQLESFNCPKSDGCRACKQYELLVEGKGEFVGNGEYGHDIFILPEDSGKQEKESTIL